MDYVEAQLAVAKARVLYWHAMIISGAYANRKMFHGTTNGTPFTEQELLQDAFETMERHIHTLQSLADHISHSTVKDAPQG